jgi:hypothetical protein
VFLTVFFPRLSICLRVANTLVGASSSRLHRARKTRDVKLVAILLAMLACASSGEAFPRLLTPDFQTLHLPGYSGFTIAIEDRDQVLASGNFTHVNGIPARGLVRISAGGLVDTSVPTFDESLRVLDVARSDERIAVLAADRMLTQVPTLLVLNGREPHASILRLTDVEPSFPNISSMYFGSDGALYFSRTNEDTAQPERSKTEVLRLSSGKTVPDSWIFRIDNARYPRLTCASPGEIYLSFSVSSGGITNGSRTLSLDTTVHGSFRDMPQEFLTGLSLERDTGGFAYRFRYLQPGASPFFQDVELVRVDRSGFEDPNWRVQLVASSLSYPLIRVFADRVMLAGDVYGLTETPTIGTDRIVRRLEVNVASRRVAGTTISASSVYPVAINGDGSLFVASVLRAELKYVSVNGSVRVIASAGDSGQGSFVTSPFIEHVGENLLVAGDFEWWHEGQRYRSLMMLDRALKPVASFVPDIEGRVTSVSLASDGSFFVGGEYKGTNAGRLLRFLPNGQRDNAFDVKSSGDITAVAVDERDVVYFAGRFERVNELALPFAARASLRGELDREWSIERIWELNWASSFNTTVFPLFVSNIAPLGEHGLVIATNIESDATARFDRDGKRISDDSDAIGFAAFSLRQHRPSKRWFAETLLDARTGQTGVAQIDPATLTADKEWRVPLPIGNSAIFVGFDGGNVLISGYESARSPSGAQTIFRRLYSLPAAGPAAPRLVAEHASSNPREDFLWRAASVDTAKTKFLGTTRSELFAFTPTPGPDEEANIVEYFIPALGHYFITGREAEKRQLDALPAQFVRTGASFVVTSAGSTSNFEPGSMQPICRFYAGPPRTPVTNTHFYGVQRDCALLDRFTTFANEGYDFIAYQSANGRCKDSRRQPIHRLFQPNTASGKSNHRYLIAGTARDRMLQLGWVDEGVVFCAKQAIPSPE